MYLLNYLINPLMALFSIFTSTGVFLHDTQVDKAAVTALAPPAIISESEPLPQPTFRKSDPHTHPEHSSLSQAVRDLKAANPRIQPRRDENRRHLTGERHVKGSFDTQSSFYDDDYVA